MGRRAKIPNKKVINFRIQLTVEAKSRLVELSDRTSFTQLNLCSKLVEWFARQPDLIQNEVMGLYPDSLKKEIVKLIRKKMPK